MSTSLAIYGARAWVFGDDVDTDLLAPSAYLKEAPEIMATHCLEALDPGFAAAVRPGDAFVAGHNLGVGSSLEQAPEALKALGVRVVLAASFGRIFYRNALNLGLPALVCSRIERIETGHLLDVDPLAGTVRDRTCGEVLACEPLPEHVVEMIADGGLLAHLARRLRADGDR